MRSISTISAALAFLTATVIATTNVEFKPVSFAAASSEVVAPASLNDAFMTFRWNGDSAMADETFDLVLGETSRIQITDFKNRGDSFEVFDNGNLIGSTSPVETTADDSVYAATPEEALKDDRFSRGEFTLEKGEHKITIKATGPYEAGTAAIRVLDHMNVAFHRHNHHHHDDYDEDEDEHWEHHESNNHHHEEFYPPYYDLDLSHTITVTKTAWVEQEIPTMAPAPEPAPEPEPAPAPPVYDHGRDHSRDHSRGHAH